MHVLTNFILNAGLSLEKIIKTSLNTTSRIHLPQMIHFKKYVFSKMCLSAWLDDTVFFWLICNDFSPCDNIVADL